MGLFKCLLVEMVLIQEGFCSNLPHTLTSHITRCSCIFSVVNDRAVTCSVNSSLIQMPLELEPVVCSVVALYIRRILDSEVLPPATGLPEGADVSHAVRQEPRKDKLLLWKSVTAPKRRLFNCSA